MPPPVKNPNPKIFKELPKLGSGRLDLEAIKTAYMEGSELKVSDWLAANGYNRTCKRSLPANAWQREYAARHIQDQDESFFVQALGFRASAIAGKIDAATGSLQASKVLRDCSMVVLDRYARAAQWDYQHVQEILDGKVKPKMTATPQDLATLAGVVATCSRIAKDWVHNVNAKTPSEAEYLVPRVGAEMDPEMIEVGNEDSDATIEVPSLSPVGVIQTKEELYAEMKRWFDAPGAGGMPEMPEGHQGEEGGGIMPEEEPYAGPFRPSKESEKPEEDYITPEGSE